MKNEYHKIQTVYLRDPDNKYRTLLDGVFAKPEFEILKDIRWSFTEKVDGTNIRINWDGVTAHFQGKTDNAQIPPFLLDALADMFPAEKMLEVFGDQGGVTLYGEGFGKKIQKGHRYIPDACSFVLFDIAAGNTWFKRMSVVEFSVDLDIPCVTQMRTGTLLDAVDMCKQGFTSVIADTPAEGLVCRPIVELLDRMGNRVITKIKCKDFA